MKAARVFLIAIGIFYLLNLVGTLPMNFAPMLPAMYPGVELYAGEPVHQLLLDAWIIVGIQLGAIGMVALWGARNPAKYLGVIPVVVVTEIIDGIWDFYSITWSYEVAWMGIVTIAVHLVWIGWAWYAWRAAHAAGESYTRTRPIGAT